MRVEPDLAQPVANARIVQVGQPDAVLAGVGVRDIGRPGASEIAVQLDGPSDIHQHQKRRATFVGRQGAGVAVALVVGGQHRLIPARGLQVLAGLLGFQHEAGPPVQIDEAPGDAAVGMVKVDPALEGVGVGAGIGAGRFGLREIEQRA